MRAPPLGPLFAAQVSALHALTVDHAGGGTGFTACLLSTVHVERVMDVRQSTIILPALEVAVHAAACRVGLPALAGLEAAEEASGAVVAGEDAVKRRR